MAGHDRARRRHRRLAAVIGHGTVLAEGTPAGLKADAGKGTLDEVFLALTQDTEDSAA